MKYLDTSFENIERIKEARVNINKGIMLLSCLYGISGIFSLGLFLFGYKTSGIFMLLFCVMYIILIGALVIKRELFSIAILIKEKE